MQRVTDRGARCLAAPPSRGQGRCYRCSRCCGYSRSLLWALGAISGGTGDPLAAVRQLLSAGRYRLPLAAAVSPQLPVCCPCRGRITVQPPAVLIRSTVTAVTCPARAGPARCRVVCPRVNPCRTSFLNFVYIVFIPCCCLLYIISSCCC